jgi:peptide/nickel transport system permease protein
MLFRREALVVRRRLLQAIPIVFGIVTVNFLLLHLAPGDVIDVIAGSSDAATNPQYMAQLRAEYGLDQPIYIQYLRYVLNLAQLNLGLSIGEGRPVATVIFERLGPTVLLMSLSICVAFSVGLLLGVAAARRVHTLSDNVISTLNLILYSIPNFWLALMLIVAFSIHLGWLPVAGFRTPGLTGGLASVWDVFRHLVMPVASLSAIFVAIYTRLMRTSMIEVLDMDFITTARAKGFSERAVAYRQALRNALLPMVTFVGLQSASMLGGAVVVESVFAWPGIGTLALEAVTSRDYNLVLGILFVSSILVIFINLLVDLVYVRLDPRIELR